MKKIVACALVLSLALSGTSLAGQDVPGGKKHRRHHTALGLTVGTVAGVLLGMWAAGSYGLDSDSDIAPFFAIWTGIAAGGAIAGYAAGGGFAKDDADAALRRDATERRAVATVAREMAAMRLETVTLAHVAGPVSGR